MLAAASCSLASLGKFHVRTKARFCGQPAAVGALKHAGIGEHIFVSSTLLCLATLQAVGFTSAAVLLLHRLRQEVVAAGQEQSNAAADAGSSSSTGPRHSGGGRGREGNACSEASEGDEQLPALCQELAAALKQRQGELAACQSFEALGQLCASLAAQELNPSSGIAGQAAALLQAHFQSSHKQRAEAALDLAQAAATRSCAYLRCANLAAGGGPGPGEGSKRCSQCRAVW